MFAFPLPLLSLLRVPARSVAGRLDRPGSSFARPLSLSWVGDGVIVVVVFIPVNSPVRLSSPGFDGFLGRVGRGQPLASADQVGATRLDQRLADAEVERRAAILTVFGG